MTGQVYNGTMVYRGQVYDGAFYEYECCLPPTNYTDLMGIVRTAGTNYTDLVGVACGSFVPPVQLSPDDPMHRTTSGLDLVGGASMGLFYIISGFVLMLGYGSAPTRPPPARRSPATLTCSHAYPAVAVPSPTTSTSPGTRRSASRGTECTDCCGDGTSANAGCCFPCFCAPTKEVTPARTALPASEAAVQPFLSGGSNGQFNVLEDVFVGKATATVLRDQGTGG